jgi:hypothetical protein
MLSEISGLTSTFKNELQFRMPTIESLWAEFQSLYRHFSDGPFSPRVYYQSDHLQIRQIHGEFPFQSSSTCCLSDTIEHLASYRHKIFPTMNVLAAELFQASRTLVPVQRKVQMLKSVLTASLQEKASTQRGLGEDLQKNLGRGIFQKYSNLLYTKIEKAQKGIDRITVPDLFDAAITKSRFPSTLSSVSSRMRIVMPDSFKGQSGRSFNQKATSYGRLGYLRNHLAPRSPGSNCSYQRNSGANIPPPQDKNNPGKSSKIPKVKNGSDSP